MNNTHPSSHPPHPPATEDDRVAWLRLLRSRRVGPTTFYRLLAEHGSAQAALNALPQIAKDAGVKNYEPCSDMAARSELATGAKHGAKMLCSGAADYPVALAQIPDAPPILWAMGQVDLLTKPMIALVGARNASSLGTRMAKALSAGLGEKGYVIVSGLARGIDTAAHLTSLTTGTVAVTAGGVDVIYPAENTQLGEAIGQQGLRLSETPFGRTPRARDFPRRNRIISGLSQALVVVEAAAKSGSLITARNALDQGRDVLAVPGHPMDPRAAGCNMLLRDGAKLVRNVDDIIEALPQSRPAEQLSLSIDATPLTPLTPSSSSKRAFQKTVKLHEEILKRLGPSPMAEDQLIRDLNAPTQAVSTAVTDLEIDGQITRQSGGLLSLRR